MESTTNSHLLGLHSYLLKNLQERCGVNIIKTQLITKHQLQCPEYRDDVIKFDKMCPRCFTCWSEGNYSLKFKSSKDHTKRKTRIMVIKCFNCCKLTPFLGNSSYRITRKNKMEKSKPIRNAKNSCPRLKKKQKVSGKKKSTLSSLNELL